MADLKPCPKCGDSWLYASEGDYGSVYESLGYRVGCACGYAWKTIGWNKTEQEAIDAWNYAPTVIEASEDGEQDGKL